jgi:hypothetical protein
VASAASLQFNGGVNNLNAATTAVTGPGGVTVAGGEVDFGGNYAVTGATSVTGGTADFLNGGSTGKLTNSGGTVQLAAGTTFTVTTGNYTQSNGGSTYLNGGTLSVASTSSVVIGSGTYLYGPGTISGNLSNSGYVFVGGGSAPGTLSVTGNYTQASTGTLFVQIDGSSAGQLDLLAVGGKASLGGTLTVTLGGGYSSPPTGTTFTIITYTSESGNFTTKNLGGLTKATIGATSYFLTA